MARIIWTRSALARIKSIREYIRQFDPRAASRVAARLLEAGESLASFPRRGRSVGDGYRELPSVKPYVILYEAAGDVIYILYVRHGAQSVAEPLDK